MIRWDAEPNHIAWLMPGAYCLLAPFLVSILFYGVSPYFVMPYCLLAPFLGSILLISGSSHFMVP